MTSYYERLIPRKQRKESKSFELEEGTTALRFIEVVQTAILAEVPSDQQKTCTIAFDSDYGGDSSWLLMWTRPETDDEYNARWRTERNKVVSKWHVRRLHYDGKLRSARFELSRASLLRRVEIENMIHHLELSFIKNLAPIPEDDSPLPPLRTTV